MDLHSHSTCSSLENKRGGHTSGVSQLTPHGQQYEAHETTTLTYQLECRTDDFLAGARPLLQASSRLPQRTLEVTRVADANRAQPSGSALSSVEFHPSGQLLLTAGLDRRLHFFQVSPEEWLLQPAVSCSLHQYQQQQQQQQNDCIWHHCQHAYMAALRAVADDARLCVPELRCTAMHLTAAPACRWMVCTTSGCRPSCWMICPFGRPLSRQVAARQDTHRPQCACQSALLC